MNGTGTVGIILIIINVLFSYKGLTNNLFMEGYTFGVDRILINKDYKRLITSGFLHVSWLHLIFNMFSLLAFSGQVESYLGPLQFLIVYMISLIGGNLFALYIHRNHGDYRAAGASGAICGIIFASIALFPGMGIGVFMLPVSIPAWLYGLVYVLFSIYGIRSKAGNVGHEAHLGGAVAGMVIALLMHPDAIAANYITILIILVPTAVFIYMIVTRPQTLLVDSRFIREHQNYYSIDHKYNAARNARQQEIDVILDKINRKGIDSLSAKEKQTLEDYSR